MFSCRNEKKDIYLDTLFSGMASGTFNDTLVNPLDANRGSYQYPSDTAMDYSALPDLHADQENYYDPAAVEEDQFGPEVEGAGIETEGYGENDLPDLDGEQEGYEEEGFGLEDGDYDPENEGEEDDEFEESDCEDSDEEEDEEGEMEDDEEEEQKEDYGSFRGLGMSVILSLELNFSPLSF